MQSVIAGVGMTELSADSGRPELALAVEAVRAALDDAGLEPKDVDGFVNYTSERVGLEQLHRALGVPALNLYTQVPFGGPAACGTVAVAASAVDAGMAKCVVCYRSLNGRSGVRLGRAERHDQGGGSGAMICRTEKTPAGVYAGPAGLLTPTQVMATWARRYAYDHGLSDERLSEALGAIAVVQREYAQTNPRAVTRGKTLTMEDYFAGRMIAEPLRIYDLCRETDGAAAVVITSRKNGSDRGVRVRAGVQELFPHSEPVPAYPTNLTSIVQDRAVAELFSHGEASKSDVDVALIYDATTIAVLLTLEDYGFCEPGGAVEYLISRQHGPDGSLPMNPHGGLLSEGYVHGMNTVIEGVRQVRGEAANQVDGAELALVAIRGAALLLEAPR